MKRAVIIVCLLGLGGLGAGAAQADSVLNRAYGIDKLDAFWRATLGSEAPDTAPFEMFEVAADIPEPVSEPSVDFGVPIIGEVLGETAPVDGGQGARLAFPVIPLDDEEAGPMMRRLAWAELYLTRVGYYAEGSEDSSAEVALLAQRQKAAAVEAYLALARLYFAAPDLTEKCTRLTRMAALEDSALEMGVDVALPEGWGALLPLKDAAAARLGDSALTDLVCAFEPVRGRAETVRLIEVRVRERIALEARAKVEDSLRLLRAAAAEFQGLVNEMDVEILTAEILELERVFGNAAANIRLVQNDQLRAEETIAELEAVDLSALNQPGEMSEYQAAQGQMAAMVALMDGVLTELEALAPLVPDDGLAECRGLGAVYDAPDMSLDSFTLTAAIEGPYVACLAQARALVEAGTTPSLQTELMGELAKHVGQISANLLEELQ